MVALMLSSQTKDEVTYAGVERLMRALAPEPCAASLVERFGDREAALAELLCPVGFYRNKARFLLGSARICLEKHGGDIPDSLDGLLALPGIGPKMGHIIMDVAWRRTTGIGVDTHVHRITNRLRWLRTSTPEETRVQLESFIPRDMWSSLNPMLVGFGQQTCLPVRPRCDICKIAPLCPTGRGEVHDMEDVVSAAASPVNPASPATPRRGKRPATQATPVAE